MECIKYINDLETEIQILKDLKGNIKCDVSEIDEKIKNKEQLINKCKENLSKLSDNQICYRIYLHMLNGLNPSKAVEKVAEENYINDIKPNAPSNLWKYYKKIQKKLKTGVKQE